MAKISVEANQCDVCGHVWLPSGKPAVQCAKCRSRKWDRMPDSSFGDRLIEVSAMSGALGINRTSYPGKPPKSPERTVEYEE